MSSLPDFETEFTCSKWSKRFATSEEVIANFLKISNEESDKARKNIKCTLNVPYGDHPKEILDIYGDDLPEDAPIFIYIHGGYWQDLTKDSSAYCVEQLVSAGIRVILVEYELCPKVTLEEIVRQVKKSVKFSLKMAAHFQTKYVSIAGHSAGAHLLLCILDEEFTAELGTDINLIKNLYLISGVYDLRDLRATKSVNNNNILSITDENVERLSPLLCSYQHLGVFNFKVHVLVAEHEGSVFHQQAVDVKNMLEKKKVRTSHAVLPNLDHFDIVENMKDKDFVVTKMIVNDTNGFTK